MIYFIRHGETEYNRDFRFQGHLDNPLSDVGINQAKTACENSKNYKFDKIYCSPLIRARQTADIINSYHNLEIIEDDRLKEIYMGSLQGRFFKYNPVNFHLTDFNITKFFNHVFYFIFVFG